MKAGLSMPEHVGLKLKINGMHCDACVRRLTMALGELPGVQITQVEIGSAELIYDPLKSDTKAIAEAISEIGFEAHS